MKLDKDQFPAPQIRQKNYFFVKILVKTTFNSCFLNDRAFRLA